VCASLTPPGTLPPLRACQQMAAPRALCCFTAARTAAATYLPYVRVLCREDIVLRKDIEARRLRWTITDTTISGDSAFLLYSSISQFVHLVRLEAGAGPVHSISNITEVHEELDFLVRCHCLCPACAMRALCCSGGCACWAAHCASGCREREKLPQASGRSLGHRARRRLRPGRRSLG
jgi:hypothetical protein